MLGSPDLFFSTIYFSPVFRKLPVVSVIYDITTMRYAPYIDERKMFDLRMRNTIHRSKALIAISEYTRRDVIEYYNAPPEKIFTVPLAADSAFGPSRDEDGIKTALKKYGIPLKYILYTGNLGPHKNLKTLVEAYYLLKKRRAIEHKLVLCGNKRWGGEVVEKINALNLENDVLLLDYVPDADLPHLYHGAEVFVYISLYEGFGLPVLEAMQSGAPVVASNVTSIPEVAGNACLLVDPLDMEGVAGAIIKLIEDGKLRERLAALGLARAAMFGWDKTAKETLRIFETAAG
ncbi:MAG: glycosyltransferase family 4 protein [Kiritimatiellae bacterium]|nr:glycosyltransferase family 4 protein [Kiritimatiellia bacterium]